MACGGDEVEHDVHAIIPEAGITLDAALLSQNIVILALEVSDNF